MVAKQWENHGTCAVSVVLECSENPHSQGVPFWKQYVLIDKKYVDLNFLILKYENYIW